MGKRIDPFSDTGFKNVFGKEENKHLLISFLNSLLKGEYVITDVSYLDKEQSPLGDGHRSMIYDVYCKTNDGKYVICEMQNYFQDDYGKRSICYASSAVLRQCLKGNDWKYNDVKTVLCISVLNFESPELSNEGAYRKDVVLIDRDTLKVFSDDIHLIYLTMPHFKKGQEECENDLDLWLYNLLHMKTMEELPEKMKGGVFEDLWKVLDFYSLSEDEQVRYERQIKAEVDRRCILDSAKRRSKAEGKAEGLAEGKAEGKAEGLAEGLAEGVAKGRAEEHVKVVDSARAMKSNGLSIDIIKQCTGLSEEEINTL
jgi:predicted transposase/invertase (TIGR01784 family)